MLNVLSSASALSPVASGHELGIAADGQSASGILQESDDIGIIQRAAPQSLDTAGEPELADPLFSASLDSFLDGNDDPILEFSRFMNSAELNVDWDAMLADPLPALPIAHTESNAVQQVTPDSTDLSRVPDDPSGDGVEASELPLAHA
ncbi:hypothetical protein N8T08_007676 [Aspergillus melleus]|uniref:Uncharacterized protein n=1 Tax=Aspergillus melleus TaxID=138277 RepID=A0ACC3BEB3_9EURO|nr:hypothetical protein N8T08_007676 [Aspergillus melleus]